MKKDTRSDGQPARKLAIILVLTAIPVLVGLGIAGILISRGLYKPVIGFLDVPESVREAIEETTASWGASNSLRFRFTNLNAKTVDELKKQFLETDLLVTSSGLKAASLSNLAKRPNPAILGLMPSAMRNAGVQKERQYAFPIVLDHFELAWNIQLLAKTGQQKPTTLPAMLAHGGKNANRTIWPMIVAGADDRILLGFIGSISESIFGLDRWKAIQRLAAEKTPDNLVQSPELTEVLDNLAEWRRNKFLHPEWFRMTQQDVIQFMENDNALFVGMFLSNHRQVPVKTIEKFESTFFPASSIQRTRSFTVPVILVMQPNKERTQKSALDFAAYLVQDTVQSKIAGKTGLAPSNSQCEAPDKQASEVRLWAASSANLLPSFSSALYTDPTDTKKLAQLIREYLESR